MSLAPGVRLGLYEIVSLLGSGGMGEVYRARDAKLNRDVAIKVLPEAFASDPERVARFTREAQTLAALNHPNIAQVYGLEEAPGTSGTIRALVMELVEGEDLSTRLARGPLPTDDALAVARQVADALEAAHEQGIVHRDLKPANIQLRPDGTVKVLDFGLAKAIDPAGPASGRAANSPTLTAMATQMGVIIGTAAYMSPEQAKGKAVDRRSDIWAFGCVLYEMLTGRAAFEGEDIAEILGAIVKTEPEWARLPAATPRAVRTLLRRCLMKDVRKRLQHIGDARIELNDAADAPASDESPARARGLTSRVAFASVAGAVLAGAAVAALLWPRAPAPSTALRVNIDLGAGAAVAGRNQGASVVLSRDGTRAAFVGQKAGERELRLYVRNLDLLQAEPIEGTDNVSAPFFSPDGEWVAYFANNKLFKVSVRGGPPVALADAPNGRGGAWGDDGAIYFAPDRARTGIVRVAASGGTPAPVTTLSGNEATHRWPQPLPDGAGILYTAHSDPSGGFDEANLFVQPPDGAAKLVRARARYGRYVDSGHLMYVLGRVLYAVAFDLDRLETIGEPVPVVQGVASSVGSGGAQFDVAANGTLVYLPGIDDSLRRSVDWIDASGRRSPLRAAVASWTELRLAPDGSRLVMSIRGTAGNDIWTYDIARDQLGRVTHDERSFGIGPLSPDGRDLVLSRQGNLFLERIDGTAEASQLTTGPATATSWHPKGTALAYSAGRIQTEFDLWILPLAKGRNGTWVGGEPSAILKTSFSERDASFSPDGRWIAYQSNETGRDEIYVRPFPALSPKWQVSSDEGMFPIWSRTRSELFFRNDGGIYVASYSTTGDVFQTEKPRLWAAVAFEPRGSGRQREYDLHPDGMRFAVPGLSQEGSERQESAVFVFNVFDELRRLAPVPR